VSARRRFSRKPRVLVGTFAGTIASYLFFFHHYTHEQDDDEAVRVWFGMRGDGRCGRDFTSEWMGETRCGKGQCCSSHGWCGKGEEYCSVALGCQSGCWPGTAASTEGDVGQASAHAEGAPDDDEYVDRMHHYRYDYDGDSSDYYRRRYGSYPGYHGDHHDYHHQYDSHHDGAHHDYGDDPHPEEDEEHDHEALQEEHERREHREHAGDEEYPYDGREQAGKDESAEELDKGPEVVGFDERKHLGEGDGVPLHADKGA